MANENRLGTLLGTSEEGEHGIDLLNHVSLKMASLIESNRFNDADECTEMIQRFCSSEISANEMLSAVDNKPAALAGGFSSLN